MGYKHFCDQLPKEQIDKCCLLTHTQPRDQNGTDLPVVSKTILCQIIKFILVKTNYPYNN